MENNKFTEIELITLHTLVYKEIENLEKEHGGKFNPLFDNDSPLYWEYERLKEIEKKILSLQL